MLLHFFSWKPQNEKYFRQRELGFNAYRPLAKSKKRKQKQATHNRKISSLLFVTTRASERVNDRMNESKLNHIFMYELYIQRLTYKYIYVYISKALSFFLNTNYKFVIFFIYEINSLLKEKIKSFLLKSFTIKISH